nr:NAD(P)H-hydrate dehydratase [Saprospiraceae bacterium]
MERASAVFCEWFSERYPSRECNIAVFSGSGNNGGDGLAVARMLKLNSYKVDTFFIGDINKASADCKTNYYKYNDIFSNIIVLNSNFEVFFAKKNYNIIIDGILGAGLDRPLKGVILNLVQWINKQEAAKISIDIPTGLFVDQPTTSESINADHVLSFEFPKLAFLLPENAQRVKNWEFRSIGLHPRGIEKINTPHLFITQKDMLEFVGDRSTFSHKGTYGKALIIAGQYGFAGAALLAARACMKSGCGLLYLHLPSQCVDILQSGIPEAVCFTDPHLQVFSTPPNLENISAVGCGPGIGTSSTTAKALKKLITASSLPLVIDADALNIIASHQWLDRLPPHTIITPHPGEFERLFGKSQNHFQRLELQKRMSVKYKIIIVLKGAYTTISSPDGEVFFNSTGNPGMATAGSGDVLTGILTAIVAKGRPPLQASIFGVYLHGLAGDLASKKVGEESLMASDIIDNIPSAFMYLKNTYHA